MKRVGFLYDDIFLEHTAPRWHPERAERLPAIIASLQSSGLWNRVSHLKPRKASVDELAAVHSEDYVRRMAHAPPAQLDPDTYFSRGSFEAASHAAGALLTAVDAIRGGAIDRAFCCVRPPGHHAEAHRAMGFCIFNNIAVGARYAQKNGFPRVFIVDFDVHHGNGTEHMFYEDDTVFYFSSHQYPHYPGTGSSRERGRGKGEGYNVNIPLSSGAGDAEFDAIYRDALPRLVRDFYPDILLVSAGYDLYGGDPLASLHVSDSGVRSIVSGILSANSEIPSVFTLEGGYDLAALGRGVGITVEEMMKH